MLRFPLHRMPRRHARAAAATGLFAVVALAAAACSSASASTASNAAGHLEAALASPLPRGSAAAGSIRITGAYLPQPATPDVAAVYFTVADIGDQPDVLVSAVSTPGAQVSLMSESATGGAETMTPLSGGLPVPTYGRVTLDPGGYHLMLTNPATPLKQGDTVTLALRFEHAG